jgi:LysR family cys regulon transcriptional activator
MNLTQLRYLRGIAEQGYNISRAAAALHTSQPGISKQIQLLEREIGVAILERRGNRIVGVTEPGRAILNVARRMLGDAETLRRIGEEFTQRKKRLVVATTHIYARYVLRSVIQDFMHLHPDVQLTLHQGSPSQIAQWVAGGDADVGISSEPPEPLHALAMLPCSSLQRSVITRRRHPLLKEKRVTLARLANYPLLTLDQSFPGGAAVMRAFARARIEPDIVLSAIDADVIKTYVELGLGIAILPSIAYEPARDRKLAAIDASHLFEPTVTQIVIRRDSYLRAYLYDFIRMIAPDWPRVAVDRAVKHRAGETAAA